MSYSLSTMHTEESARLSADMFIDISRDLAGLFFFGGHKAMHPTVHVTGSARRLVEVASRLLPTTDRARYSKEYRSELWDLAAAGAGRRQQIGYALRQFRCAVPLRFAVLSPHRRKASL